MRRRRRKTVYIGDTFLPHIGAVARRRRNRTTLIEFFDLTPDPVFKPSDFY